MSKSTIFLLIFVIGATSIGGLAATECPDLESADSDPLISYLAAVAPNQDNSRCVTFVIKHLDSARYEPAIPVLVRLLDFHRPPNEAEKAGVALHPPTIDEFYPAANALEEIGKAALPALLEAIKSSETSTIARRNAVSVWMVIYKYEPSKGIAKLQRESVAAADSTVNDNWTWALAEATRLCNPSQKARCNAAAMTPTP